MGGREGVSGDDDGERERERRAQEDEKDKEIKQFPTHMSQESYKHPRYP